MVFEDNFLRLTVTVRFQKNEYFKNVNVLILLFQSISHNNVIAINKITFIPHF